MTTDFTVTVTIGTADEKYIVAFPAPEDSGAFSELCEGLPLQAPVNAGHLDHLTRWADKYGLSSTILLQDGDKVDFADTTLDEFAEEVTECDRIIAIERVPRVQIAYVINLPGDRSIRLGPLSASCEAAFQAMSATPMVLDAELLDGLCDLAESIDPQLAVQLREHVGGQLDQGLTVQVHRLFTSVAEALNASLAPGTPVYFVKA